MPPGQSKVALYAALRRDAREGMSNRALERKYRVGWRTVQKVLSSASDVSHAPAVPQQAAGNSDLAAAPPSGTAEPAGTPSSGSAGIGEQQAEYRRGLLAEAAVFSVRLICHKGTWAFLLEKSLAHAHFRLPDRISDTDDGQIHTHFTGRSLLAALVTTRNILDRPADDELAAWVPSSPPFARYIRAEVATRPPRNAARTTTPGRARCVAQG